MTTMTKRTYTRRTEDERIAELEAQIRKVKDRLENKKQKESPLLREWTKAQRSVRKFIQAAAENGRSDLSLSAEAFLAGLERSMRSTSHDGEGARGRRRAASDDDDS